MPEPIRSLLLLACLLAAAPTGAEPVPGTGVDLTPPAGFAPAKRFAGFVDRASGASIMVNELPGPFDQVTAAFRDPALLAAQGLRMLGNQALTIDGRPALLVQAAQQAQGVDYRKWMLALDTAGGTTLIAANYPADSADTVEQPLREALLGTRLGEAPSPAQALPFTLAPPAPFALAKVIGQSAIYTPDGAFPIEDETQPLLAVGLSIAAGPPVIQRQAFAEERITRIATVSNIRVESSSAVGIDGLLGVRTLASGRGNQTGAALTVFQVMLFDTGGYALIHGIFPSAERERLLPLYDAAAESFALKQPAADAAGPPEPAHQADPGPDRKRGAASGSEAADAAPAMPE